MKRAILIISAAIIASTLMGANEKYTQKMGETITQFSTCRSIEDFQNLANKFRIIANVETEEWLPLYYEAQCYITMSFMDRSGAEGKDAYLDQANTSIEKMLELAPDESEVYALQAFYYTGRLVVNPPERAQTTAPMVSVAIGKSLGLNPNNPRAKYIRLSNEIGTARFFGSDTTPYCKSARELLDQWDSYQVKSAIHPAWGKDQVEEIVNDCGA
ncbi:MAG: hypothetical protein ABFS38_01840 [Bacteroidota bacterium]